MKKTLQIDIKEPGLWQVSDITYGQVPGWFGHTVNDLKMSIIRNFENQSKKLPCVVWICGGGWQQMDYNLHLPNLVYLAKKGYVVASVEYRCDVTFPSHLEQVKQAIRYLRANAEKYQIDIDNFGVMGESAGGTMSALIGTTGETREFDKGDYLEFSSAVQAACTWYMISDFNMLAKRAGSDVDVIKHMLGFNPLDDEKETTKANPGTYICDKTPPFLLLHGTADVVVPCEQTEMMYSELIEKGVEADFYALEGVNHAKAEFFQKEINEIITKFFDKNLKKK